MNTHHLIGLSMLAGIALGAATVQGLHAQAKPPIYTVAEISITNMDGYMKEYVPQVQAYNKKSGAKLLAASVKITPLNGTAPQRAAINIWDSMEKLQAARNDAEFKKIRAIGEKYATFREYAVEGLAQ
jgi:uncharacterized protein (DUF1330 family)